MVLLEAFRLRLRIIFLVSVRTTSTAIFFANANASDIGGSRRLRLATGGNCVALEGH